MPKIVAQKTDWLKLGFNLFSRKGPTGLVVEQMAKTLNCNKSSFYWHFKSKEAFMDDLVEMWRFSDTQLIIDLANAIAEPHARYHKFIGLVFQKDPYLDFVFYLKRYARKRPALQVVISQVDQQRLQFVADLLQDLGVSNEVANNKAKIFYKYLIGFHEMYRYEEMESGYMDTVRADLQIIHGLNIPSTNESIKHPY